MSIQLKSLSVLDPVYMLSWISSYSTSKNGWLVQIYKKRYQKTSVLVVDIEITFYTQKKNPILNDFFFLANASFSRKKVFFVSQIYLPIICWEGVTSVSNKLLTVKLTSIRSAPAVLFMIQTYMPESSTNNSWRMSTSKWCLIFGLGNTCLKPTPSILNQLEKKISFIILSIENYGIVCL